MTNSQTNDTRMELDLNETQSFNPTVEMRVRGGFDHEKIGVKAPVESPICESNEINFNLKTLESECKEILSFNTLTDGWDGEGSLGPTKESINDAIAFVNNWSNNSMVPEPEMVFEGVVALQFYDENGDSKGGIEFRKGHLGVYAIFDKNENYETGRFNSSSIFEIKGAVKHIEKVLMNGS